MINILAKGKTISIVIEENNLITEKRKYLIMYRNNLYDPANDFRPSIEQEGIKRLYPNLIDEYWLLKKEADEEFTKRIQKSKKETDEMGLVDTMKKALIGALCEQTSTEILKSVMPDVREKIINEFGKIGRAHV